MCEIGWILCFSGEEVMMSLVDWRWMIGKMFSVIGRKFLFDLLTWLLFGCSYDLALV